MGELRAGFAVFVILLLVRFTTRGGDQAATGPQLPELRDYGTIIRAAGLTSASG